jgi:hypothetical protein
VFVQLEDDSPTVEKLRGSLVPVAGCATAWHNVGDDGACVGGLLQSPLPCGCSWWCVVSGVFISVHEFVRVVVCASARYIPIMFFLK